MGYELAVLVIHGMGTQLPGYANELIMEINKNVAKLKKNASEIAWRSVYWADILQKKELRYYRDAKRSNDLDFLKLRKFMITSFGDASAYRKTSKGHNSTYDDIHDRIAKEISLLYVNDLESQPKPLIILAHSLGGHIISNYIWDMQKFNGKAPGLSKFEQMMWLSGIVTFGCNIPLFTFALSKVEPIKFPLTSLRKDLKKKAKWFNYYDPDDVLGYPLKPINHAYRQVVNGGDIPINVGGVTSSWNPLSHTNYWTDNSFTKPVAKYLARFL